MFQRRDATSKLELVKLLVANGANVNSNTKTGTPLLAAMTTKGGKIDIVEFLLSSGADLKATDDRGYRPLLYLVYYGAYEPADAALVKLLVAKGADVNEQTPARSGTALMIAASRAQDDLVELLLSLGADTELKDKDGRTALSFAAASGKSSTLQILLKRTKAR